MATARSWGTTLSHLLTGEPGWADWDRRLVLALSMHDDDLCPSKAGPEHYRDECDTDTTDIEPEPVEQTCVYLKASEQWSEERSHEKNPEQGVLVGFRDAAAQGGGAPDREPA